MNKKKNIQSGKSEERANHKKDLSQVKLYIHRETSQSSDPSKIMNIVVGDVEEIDPTIDYETLMRRKRRVRNSPHYSKSLKVSHRNTKIKTLK